MSSIGAIPMEDWRSAVLKCVEEMSNQALEQPLAAQLVGVPSGKPCGAFIPLMCSKDTLRVGVVASAEGCAAIAAKFTGAAEAAGVAHPEVADAMCEFLNLVAGAVQRAVSDRVRLRIGLPMFISGALHLSGNIEMDEQFVRLGDVPVTVTVFRYQRE